MSRHELKALFPAGVELCVVGAADTHEPLFAEEEAYVARAVDKRRREFTAGRTAARRALAALGLPALPLAANEDRSVCWPDAVWGSITHTEGLCAAVAAPRELLRGVGIDAELRARVNERLWEQIATEREIAWFRAAADATRAAERATLLFSAKEAFYKAQYCVSRTYVGFHEVELAFDASGGFEVTLQNAIGPSFAQGARFLGRYTQLAEHVVTGLVIAR